jgi:hypothetical protein
VNGDGEINIADVSDLINIILSGHSDDPDAMKRADVNMDGEISVGDVTDLINIILKT